VTSTQILEARQLARGAERFKRGKRAEERAKSRGRRKNAGDLLQISEPLCSTQFSCSVWVCYRL
jgi:hypothetical protein